MECIFGPVNSRRLGRSLGVDLIPLKYCTYDCIYCQLGRTTNRTLKREVFVHTKKVHYEIREFLSEPCKARSLDVISLAGSGEPTLASNCGEVIRWIKDFTPIPLAVLTNSSLMWMEEVQEDLLNADMILPSIDAVSEDVFQKINRPHPNLSLEKILEGIVQFAKIYKGKIFPEIMIIQGINDTEEEIKRIISFLDKIHPDRVHLNVAERPGGKGSISPPMEWYENIKRLFPSTMKVDIVGKDPPVISPMEVEVENLEEKIIAYLLRRPAVPGDLASGIGVRIDRIYPALEKLEKEGRIVEVPDRTDNYYYVNVPNTQFKE